MAFRQIVVIHVGRWLGPSNRAWERVPEIRSPGMPAEDLVWHEMAVRLVNLADQESVVVANNERRAVAGRIIFANDRPYRPENFSLEVLDDGGYIRHLLGG